MAESIKVVFFINNYETYIIYFLLSLRDK